MRITDKVKSASRDRVRPMPVAQRIAREGEGLKKIFAACTIGLALACTSAIVCAQSPESDLTPESEVLAKDASHFALPDFTDKELESIKVQDSKDRFSIKFGLAMLFADYTDFSQDAGSVQQVGVQDERSTCTLI